MKKKFTLSLIYWAVSVVTLAQVKSAYIYNTSMPYGTLDIRTQISSTYYYYLQEGITFSYRESAPGVRTNTYRDMTSFESSPYQQGNLRLKNGATDKFIMNYRLLLPQNYQSTYAEGYPLVILMHGGGERGNCYYNNCFHATQAYDPNKNSPPAPTTVDHQLLNNDYNLNIGGKQHLDARNLAGTRLPNDPAMPARAFPGFVLIPQMMNVWDSLNVQDLIRIVRLHCEKYKIDQNRIYIHGLSIGGYAVYEAMKRASWLFAAALPMSAVKDASIFKQNQQDKVSHIPLWAFQGGIDKNPSPVYTQSVMTNFRNAGTVVRYTEYAGMGHSIWNKAYGEADFFTWMLSKNKANIQPHSGNTVIIKSKNQYPKLMLAEGFLAYQWQKDGVVISTAKSNIYTPTVAGTYRARFSRVSYTPTTEAQWNRWSAPIVITESAAAAKASTSDAIVIGSSEAEFFSVEVFPNPTSSENITLQINTSLGQPVEVRLIDQIGKEHYTRSFEGDELKEHQNLKLRLLPDGLYILCVSQGRKQLKQKLIIHN
jgi:hypothetical protein